MITAEKLKTYKRYRGDVDAWARGSLFGSSDDITDQDWAMIDELLQSLTIVRGGLASPEFVAKTNAQIADRTVGEEAYPILIDLAEGL
jgi:hypothetical protein